MVDEPRIEVRNLVDADVDDACTLLNVIIDLGGTTAFENRLTNDEFKTLFVTSTSIIFSLAAVGSDGALIGFQALARNQSLPADWADIATFAQHRPKVPGVGRALFGKSRYLARSFDIVAINATVRADNVSGLAYYTRMGFVEYAVAKDVPLQDGTLIDRISHRYAL